MRIAMIGKGRVGSALAPALRAAGHAVTYGTRNPADPSHNNDDGIPVMTVREAAQSAEIVVLAVNWGDVDQVLADCGDLDGRILIDCTNPLTFGAEGISLALGFDRSGGEIVASKTRARVVKTLNHVGSPVMATAKSYRQRPIQFVAADDEDARRIAASLVRDIGFEPVEYGGLENARKLEPLAMIWIDQAYKHGMNLTNALAFIGPES